MALHKSRRELYESMDLDELAVWWPAYFAAKHRMEAEVRREQQREEERQRRKIG